MAPPSPFCMSPFLMTPTISRQVLGPRVPTSLRAITSTARPATARTTAATATAPAPGAVATQKRGYAFGMKGSDMGENKTHVTDKKPSDSKYDVQSSASKSGMADHAASNTSSDTQTGHARSQAAMQKDENKGGEKAKQEHPEAPEPIIGMSDERGGRSQ